MFQESENIPGDLLECTTEATSRLQSETITENVDETKSDIQQSVIKRKRKVNEPPKERKKRRPRRGAVLEGPKFQCDVCDFQSGLEATLKNHKERKHDNTYYLCQPCSGIELQLYLIYIMHIIPTPSVSLSVLKPSVLKSVSP